MAIQVWPALGTAVAFDQTTPGTYVTIGQVQSIKGPDRQVGSAKTTHLGSTSQTYRPTLHDGGDVTFDVFYDPTDAVHTALSALMATPVMHLWKVTYASSPAVTVVFSGFLTKLSPEAKGEEDNLTCSFTVKVSGAVTVT